MYPSVADLLRAHRITAPERPFSHNGYSGARIASIEQDGERYLLKRFLLEDDWIMRVTRDITGREAEFAASPVVARLPARVRVPTLGAARDGDGWALLLRDITPLLLPDEGIVPAESLDAILAAIAELHAAFWRDPLASAGIRWLDAETRLRIVSPAVGAMLVAEGRDFGVARGWQAFDDLADGRAVRLARGLFADMSPLVQALTSFPRTLVHGDLKLANMGMDGDILWLFDWADVSRAPVALEIAWFLAVNSSRLPRSLDATLDHYATQLQRALGDKRLAEAQWPAQRGAAMVCGLLMYGWGKALDAETGRPNELRWWCEGALEAQELLRL